MEDFMDLLKIYYSRVFPLDDYYKWLSYGDADTFQRREFSFTLDGDVYVRYQAFHDQHHLAKELTKMVPIKIDIGAVFNVFPGKSTREKKLEAVERELVFDIDLTDYDEVRTCCSGADICNKCWKYMVIACRILDVALREDFGFEHILWVFSGRRGVHAWVCDASARYLDSIQRGSVAEYLQLIAGGAYTSKKVNLYKIHPSVARALEVIAPIFVSFCVEEQNMLGSEDSIAKFMKLLPDEETRIEMRNLFEKYTTSVERWNAFVDYVHDQLQVNNKKWSKHRTLVDEIMLQYCYPRLDINVSKGLNHLLKSPFCVHPKTGKISIPFNPKVVDKFDPLTVPTLNIVIKEIDAYDDKNKAVEGDIGSAKKIKDYKKTSLNKSLHVFQEFLRKLEHAKSDQDNTTAFDIAMEI
ncbi:hypothetical protein PV325_013506 [Microctonus aethiopoides]|nr:hypothetical protein PV325_013506 [Microctonus aethiopoides]KAK0093462.1 hypothetical protein PV326_013464 [Microctonus aethiopoides]